MPYKNRTEATKAERVKCPDCPRRVLPRGLAIHRSKAHDDRSKASRHRVGGKWVPGPPTFGRGKWPRMKHKWSLFPPSQCVCLCHPSGDKHKDCPLCYEPSEKRLTP